MTSKLQRFFACVLLVLLPLQAVAAAAMCAHAKATPAVAMDAMEHCQMAQGDAGMDHPAKPGSDNQQSCCATMACAMCSVVASTPLSSAAVSLHEQSSPFISPQYISFIPDGLQRPPTILA